ncbi:MAG: hypothetical protein GY906_29260 [bacterium]|nr:hypothetical protein [bacterium]
MSVPARGDVRLDKLRDLISDWSGGRVMVGDIILIAEMMDSDGDPVKMTLHNSEMTQWKEIGMLQSRLYDIANGEFSMDEVSDDDND